MVIDGETGLLSAPGDAAALAANLLAVLRDPPLAAGLGAAGRQRALAHFSPQRAAADWTALLERFIPAPWRA